MSLPLNQCKAVLNTAARLLGLSEVPEIKYGRGRASLAYIYDNRIVLSSWLKLRHERVVVAHILHEAAHFRHKGEHHSPRFKQTERELLTQFKLRACNYGRAYWRRLEDIETGEVIVDGRRACGL